MFERFTDRARHAVVLAQEEARDLQHNYIGTEHLLLGLLSEPSGIAARALDRFGLTLAGAREDVTALIGRGKKPMSAGHIPFTPRAKKAMELSLREALQLGHNYIGTEHILLGLIREGEGVAAQILKTRAADDLAAVRTAVLGLVPAAPTGKSRRWPRLSRISLQGEPERAPGEPEGPGGPGASGEPRVAGGLATTPAAEAALGEAARLAGDSPVGSHHLLLAALGDADSAAARALARVGVNLDRARAALTLADVTGTSDEQPEQAGRRQMLVKVAPDRLTVEAADQVIIGLGRAALAALGEQADSGTIRGDLPASAALGAVWQALADSLADIRGRAGAAASASAPAAPAPAASAPAAPAPAASAPAAPAPAEPGSPAAGPAAAGPAAGRSDDGPGDSAESGAADG